MDLAAMDFGSPGDEVWSLGTNSLELRLKCPNGLLPVGPEGLLHTHFMEWEDTPPVGGHLSPVLRAAPGPSIEDGLKVMEVGLIQENLEVNSSKTASYDPSTCQRDQLWIKVVFIFSKLSSHLW